MLGGADVQQQQAMHGAGGMTSDGLKWAWPV